MREVLARVWCRALEILRFTVACVSAGGIHESAELIDLGLARSHTRGWKRGLDARCLQSLGAALKGMESLDPHGCASREQCG
jgi:hypothetical protein